jgi:predicted RNase H-like HicB family nuclease
MAQITYKIRLQKEPEGGFTVTVPALPGCITFGKDMDEAIIMAKEAIELYIESLVEHGEEVPTENNLFEYSITVQPDIPELA